MFSSFMDSYLTNARQFAIMVEIGYLFYIDVYKKHFGFFPPLIQLEISNQIEKNSNNVCMYTSDAKLCVFLP